MALERNHIWLTPSGNEHLPLPLRQLSNALAHAQEIGQLIDALFLDPVHTSCPVKCVEVFVAHSVLSTSKQTA